MKLKIVGGVVAGIAMWGLVGAAPAQAQTFAGNELVSWSISDAPAGGVTNITFPMTVGADTARQAGTYFAMQYGFTGQSDIGYLGLQPRPDVNGRQRLHAVFSSFITGTTTTDGNCTLSADGGDGVSCATDFDATYGRTYNLTVRSVGTNTWQGDLTDTVTGVTTRIGTYTLPDGSGKLKGNHVGFVEYYDAPGCDQQPYYDITFGKPKSDNLTGDVSWTKEYGDCIGSGNVTPTELDNGVRITRGSVPPNDLRATTVWYPRGANVPGWVASTQHGYDQFHDNGTTWRTWATWVNNGPSALPAGTALTFTYDSRYFIEPTVASNTVPGGVGMSSIVPAGSSNSPARTVIVRTNAPIAAGASFAIDYLITAKNLNSDSEVTTFSAGGTSKGDINVTNNALTSGMFQLVNR